VHNLGSTYPWRITQGTCLASLAQAFSALYLLYTRGSRWLEVLIYRRRDSISYFFGLGIDSEILFCRVSNMSLTPNGSPVEAAGTEHIDGLYSYALVLTRNRSEAEDLVQETYVRALGARGGLRNDSNVKSWLFTILRNIWFNQLRHQRTAKLVAMDGEESATDIAENGKDPYAFYMSRMEHEQVREVIQQLPVEFREVLLLREFEELSYQEIATILDCPAGTVMSRLARARAKLRTLLSAAILTRDFARK
jgi:RNA polymerase sigma-70 factor (ECF subfamily)